MANSISTTSNSQTTTNITLANQAINGAHDEGLSVVQSKQRKFNKYRAMRQPNQTQVRGAE
ncbi:MULTISPECIES: hypothetical protein [Psychrobacter]|uniref:Uncharacterized protein n=1 Tax=Psychrobacter namhaensis TaxID=292734 RepID=A0ABW8LD31_9GAMM|nr:hypothetical protein [Psychrobacter proteolyticus]